MLPLTPGTQPGAGGPYRTAAGSRRRRVIAPEPEERWPPHLRMLMWLLLALAAWIAVLGWREHRARADISALPAPARRAIYGHALDELRSLCAVASGLHDHCAAQAAFILKFPDCDANCRRLADRALDRARR